MNVLFVNDNWKTKAVETRYVDFPHDELVFCERDYARAGGGKNGYYRSESFCVEREIEFPKAHKVYLEIEGARAVCDVFVGAECVACIVSPEKKLVDVTKFAGTINTVTLKFASFENSPSYTGLGLSGGISVKYATDSLYIEPDGMYVVTESDSSPAVLTAYVDIVNDSSEKRTFSLMTQTFNIRSRRVGRRTKKFKIRAHSSKRIAMPLKMLRHYDWSLSDAYLYTFAAELFENGKTLDNAQTTFGIRKAELDDQRGFVLSGRTVRLSGAVASHDNGIIGSSSRPSAEARKAAVLKDSGYNAVRYIGVPSENALDALDEAGLMCIVDIFDVLAQPKATCDGHLFFERDYVSRTIASVKTLRKHPCVIAYGICDCPPESYGRGEGAALGKKIVELIKKNDPSRFIIASASETVPSQSEMLALGARPDRVHAAMNTEGGMLSLSREKSMFRDLTADWFALGDVSGYSFLHQRYLSDVPLSKNKLLGVASRPDKAFEVIGESIRNGVLGEFTCPAIDSLGSDKVGDGISGERCEAGGDIDITCCRKARSHYREICMGKRNKSIIVVLDPENEEDESSARESWYFPRFLGRPVTVKVYTGGDVVALYLDGRLVGRKLAGKINKYVATFRVNYYPGKLEAVSFRKGSEISRCSLESVSSPKALKLSCDNKNISLSSDNMAFVEVAVTDKEGRKVTRAQRTIEVSVDGDGELFAFSSADPMLTLPASAKTLPVYEGGALIAVKAVQEGKITVKVTGEGLLSGKITLKVKP